MDEPEAETPMPEITKDEFCTRFVNLMMRYERTFNGTEAELRAYAEETAPTYWDDLYQRAEGPEECAEADLSYWEEV
jgi:hypothetical protein